jgi:proteasome assembly chaperone (PAC2) family protein
MDNRKLENPILIAAWPGMGQVALTACYYMISRLKMEFRAEYAASELFDADHVLVEAGLVQPFRYPKNQVFALKSPEGVSDLLVFIGEAQPPHGRYNFCRKLVDFAQREGVATIFTFAALASGSELHDESRVVAAATDKETLHQLLECDIGLLRSGSISGMNGILLGVVAERKMAGGCLLGEMPAMFVNIPYPKASIAIIKAFCQLTGYQIELSELSLEAERIEARLDSALRNIQHLGQEKGEDDATTSDETYIPDPAENGKLSAEEKQMLEQLFERARSDRSKAFELKQELDRLGVFSEYEDRFLDLFKQGDQD